MMTRLIGPAVLKNGKAKKKTKSAEVGSGRDSLHAMILKKIGNRKISLR